MTASLTAVRLGTRASPLARWQADWVAAQLRAAGHAVELVLIATTGDQTVGPLGQMGGVGVFTKEIQRALLDRRVDLAVHSLKDLPTEPVAGLALAAVPPRAPIDDLLLSPAGWRLDELPPGARVGTGSPRRQAALRHARPDLQLADIRGNVDTRLAKLAAGEYDAIVLAAAGLARLELLAAPHQPLPRATILPAVGQGALGLEIRADDDRTRVLLSSLDDPPTHAAVLAERALLAALRAGCLAPVGAWGRLQADGRLRLQAAVWTPDGAQRLDAEEIAPATAALDLGRQVAQRLLESGAAAMIAQARGAN